MRRRTLFPCGPDGDGNFQHGPRVIDTTVRRRLRLQLVQRIHHRHRGTGHEQPAVLRLVRVDALVHNRAIRQAQGDAVDLIAAAAVLARERRTFDAARHRLRPEAPGRDAVPPLRGGKQAVAAFQAHVGPGLVEGERPGLGDAAGVPREGAGQGVDGLHEVRAFPEAVAQCLRRIT